jgi:hypothetical protein
MSFRSLGFSRVNRKTNAPRLSYSFCSNSYALSPDTILRPTKCAPMGNMSDFQAGKLMMLAS